MNLSRLLALSFVLVCGCKSNSGLSATRWESIESVAPEKAVSEKAKLVLAGTKYEVKLRSTRSGEALTLELLGHNEVFEKEQYKVTAHEFQLVEAAEEDYSPPIDILKFPMTVGQTWNWTGKMVTGGIPRNANAVITTVSEKLYTGPIARNTIKVTVNIALTVSSNMKPVPRQLVFWFEPKVGLIKRQFGPASVREPVYPTDG